MLSAKSSKSQAHDRSRSSSMARAPSTSSKQKQQLKKKTKPRDSKPSAAAVASVHAKALVSSPPSTAPDGPDKQSPPHPSTKKNGGGTITVNKNGGARAHSTALKSKLNLKPRACPVQNLPPEMLALLFPFLTWKDTCAMTLVNASWSRLVFKNKSAHYEWKNTVIISPNADESLAMLLRNERGCLDARFAPNLIIITVGTGDSTPFKTGGYWKAVAQTLENSKLIPMGCPVVTLFTPLGVMGTGSEDEPTAAREYEEELGEYGDSPSKTMTFSITVAHLPGTSVETATFDRKWLRQQARGRGEEPEYPFSSPMPASAGEEEDASMEDNDDSPSFLLFGVNANSAEELAPIVTKWHPGASVVGGILPFADRSIPIALYKRSTATQERGESRKHQFARKAKSKQSASSATAATAAAGPSAGTLEFPTNVLIRFHGEVGLRVFASCGFHPITPVVRCETVSTAYLMDQFAHYRAYETVVWRNPSTGEEVQYRLIDLLRQYGSFTRENSLNIYSCARIEPMEAIVRASKTCIESELIAAPPVDQTIDRLDMLICTGDGDVLSMDKHWEKGRYGFVAVQIPECGKFAHTVALKALKARMALKKEQPLGAFMISCALKGQELYGETDVETKLYEQIFPGLPLNGCFSGGEVGPVAYPLGLSSCLRSNKPQLQSNTTSGAMFYIKSQQQSAALPSV